MAGGAMSPVCRRKLFCSLGADDIIEAIKDAIAVAAQNHPYELQQRRDSIVQMLHAGGEASAAAKDESCRAVSDQVARINGLLMGEAISDEAISKSLRALKAVRMTFETLEATKIGRTVGGLRKHASEQVRRLAVGLYKSWKALADEHFRNCRSNSATSTPNAAAEEANARAAPPVPGPTSKPSGTLACREIRKDAERVRGLPPTMTTSATAAAPKLKETPLSISDEARVAMAKRKFNDGYREAAAIKKRKSIQVINAPEKGVGRRHCMVR